MRAIEEGMRKKTTQELAKELVSNASVIDGLVSRGGEIPGATAWFIRHIAKELERRERVAIRAKKAGGVQ